MKLIFLVLVLFHCFLGQGSAWNIKPIDKNSNKQAINLVFCPLNYADQVDHVQDIAIILERLKKTRPFDECMDALRIWQLSLNRKEEQKFFQPAEGMPPLKVMRVFLKGISSKIKDNNYKLIIIDAKGSVSCAELSSADKMSLVILGRSRYSNPNSFTKGFLHELGHSFGLRDECIDCGDLCPPGPPNCASTQQEAQKWWGDMVGKVERVNYINGCCGNKNYLRPVIASLMNDTEKAEDFGPVNERYLNQQLRRD